MADIHFFGIRHHGPGSARSLLGALHNLQPDVILIEGPADAQPVLPFAAGEMHPPVAILLYAVDNPRQSVYDPFTIFSPEWIALQYGLERSVPVRLMDLPQANRFALEPEARMVEEKEREGDENSPPEIHNPQLEPSDTCDPFRLIALAAGYHDPELWWEHLVEHRQDSTGLFQAILEMMTALREHDAQERETPRIECLREAFMRQTIRAAETEDFKRIAVVCGAWHTPALADMPPLREDAALLKGLPSVKVAATWVPWTYDRLSRFSGYGAGLDAPEWYHLLWECPSHIAMRWLTRVAHLLRGEGLDTSTAHIIEGVRLAESLSAVRDRPQPGLPELMEAVQSIFCFGDPLPLRLIEDRLITGVRMGTVSPETPMLPLQKDLQAEQKRLRLPPEAMQKQMDLDLRKPFDLDRSHLLHRLKLLGIPWGTLKRSYGKAGTFHELWDIQWKPEYEIPLIEANVWGNTLPDAATAKVVHEAGQADLPALTQLTEETLLANLPDATGEVMRRLQDMAAVSTDTMHLMSALPPLANVLRYGSVRRTDTELIRRVVDGLITRTCLGLPLACASLNDDAAAAVFERLIAFHQAVKLIENEEHLSGWRATLIQLAKQQGLHGLIAGRSARLLLEERAWTPEETGRAMHIALSPAGEPSQAAAWLEGFLRGSGLMLLHNDTLWTLLDEWVESLSGEHFKPVLPLLRRTFATFPAPERRQMGERAKHGIRVEKPDETSVDGERARKVLTVLRQILGIGEKS